MDFKQHHQIVIVGAGITGLWLAKQLSELGADFVLISPDVGGLLGQVKSNGFTFDASALHVYGVGDSRVQELMSHIDSRRHERLCYYRSESERLFVPYPVQDYADQIGINVDYGSVPEYRGQSLDEYVRPIFGDQFVDQWFNPFNFRVWNIPTAMMDSDWTNGRVKIREDVSKFNWGPNAEFFYAPGGMMFDFILQSIDPDRVISDFVMWPDVINKKLQLQSGVEMTYDRLVWTPSVKFLMPQINMSHNQFRSNRVLNFCIGLKREFLEYQDFHWYYPDVNSSRSHRVTKLSNLHPSLAPKGRDSLMIETTYSSTSDIQHVTDKLPKQRSQISPWMHKVQAPASLAVEMLESVGITSIGERDILTSLAIETPGYPIPTRGVRSDMAKVKSTLMKFNVITAGRFGSHSYFNIPDCMNESEVVSRIVTDMYSHEDYHNYLYSGHYYELYKDDRKPEDYR